MVGLPRVNFLMVTSCALSLANRKFRSVPIKASLVFEGDQSTCRSHRSTSEISWKPVRGFCRKGPGEVSELLADLVKDRETAPVRYRL